MKPLVKFTKPMLPLIQDEFDAAMEKIAKKYGVKCGLSSGSWSDTTFSLRIKLEIDNPNEEPKQHYTSQGKVDVPKNGTSFNIKGKKFTVVGYSENRPKFPVSAVDEKGTRFKFTMEAVLRNIINE